MSAAASAPFLVLHPDDAVAVALDDLVPGQRLAVPSGALTVTDPVPRGHKVAIAAVPVGCIVRKYGHAIGTATTAIAPGQHVHTHNVSSRLPTAPPGTTIAGTSSAALLEQPTRFFAGFRRATGAVGTRNYIGIVTSVNCSATVARLIADRFQREGLSDFPNVDGVVALTHSSGCGIPGDGDDLRLLRRTLRGYAAHPNFAGVLAIGLGCEVNEVDEMAADMTDADGRPVQAMSIQDTGGTSATVSAGLERVAALAAEADRARRVDVPASELVLGLNCGGSDGYSGITANPALGIASDLVIAAGGTAVLGETPEIHGAEQLLLGRATPEVAADLIDLLQWWQRHAAAAAADLDNNPSPGNKDGGLTTILEKSLGAVAKGGSTPLTAVYRYADAVRAKGLVFMDTPGYDPVSVTGIVAGGANVVCFTTGRGSVFGCKPVPTMKLCTNTPTYERMRDDMDVNCGGIIDGELTVEEVGRQIFEQILEVASGRPTRSEELGLGDEEFAPWQRGITL